MAKILLRFRPRQAPRHTAGAWHRARFGPDPLVAIRNAENRMCLRRATRFVRERPASTTTAARTHATPRRHSRRGPPPERRAELPRFGGERVRAGGNQRPRRAVFCRRATAAAGTARLPLAATTSLQPRSPRRTGRLLHCLTAATIAHRAFRAGSSCGLETGTALGPGNRSGANGTDPKPVPNHAQNRLVRLRRTLPLDRSGRVG